MLCTLDIKTCVLEKGEELNNGVLEKAFKG